MKHIFFFGLLVLLPVVVIGGGIVYLVWHTCYTLYDDWRLNRELREIRAVCRARREAQVGVADPAGETDRGGETDQAAAGQNVDES